MLAMTTTVRRSLALAGLIALGSCSESPPPDAVTNLDASLAPLRAWFAEHAGQPRVLMLLSPLCPGCVDGARAAQEWLSKHDDPVAVAIVFEPMVPGDDRAAAVTQAASAPDARRRDFWDADHACARLWGATHKERIVPRLLAVTSPEAPWRDQLASWDPERQPLWDVAWFFEPDAEWPADALPEHAGWCLQFDFQGHEDGGGRSGFFRGEGSEAGVAWSSWTEQFARGMDLAR